MIYRLCLTDTCLTPITIEDHVLAEYNGQRLTGGRI